jgi:nucleotide-binding universal stress UspA family protein
MKRAITRIVAATDFSEDAGHAVLRASMLAAQLGAELELLHVVDRTALEAVRQWVRAPSDVAERLVEDARRLLQQSAASLGTPATSRVAIGGVLDEILAGVADGDLLVVGMHGLNPLRDAIVGTTAVRLLGRYPGPVLVVRRPPREPYRNAMAAVDLLPGAEHGLAGALRVAPGAKLTALHAYEVVFEGALHRAGVPMSEIERQRAVEFQKSLDALRQLSETATGDPYLFLPIAERGDAASLILERAQSLGADLIVVGKRTRSAVEALMLGSVTRHVLTGAKVDVLVVAP